MNKKGFTLVELLITIVILGIIAGISVPVLRSLQASQSEKKYKIYIDNVNYAAKLYTDSYSEDVFSGKTGCAYIKYKDMSKYHLLKDINLSGISCNTNYTFVKVVKFHDKYYYTPYIGCGAKSDSAVKAEIFKPSKPTAMSVCGSSSESSIVVTAEPDKSESKNNKQVSPIVKLVSETGVRNTPPVLDYGFNRDGSTNVINNNWTRLDFNIPSETVQEKMISEGTTQIFKATGNASTPSESGEFYLVIRITTLENLDKQPWKKAVTDVNGHTSDNYVILGPYLVDNTPPDFGDSKVISSSTAYNAKKPKLDLKVTDNLSGESDLRMCYAYEGEDDCPIPEDGEDLQNLSRYEPYDNDKVLKNIASAYDGTSRDITIWVSDAAGNVSHKTFTYSVSMSYKLTFNSDGGSSCTTGPINQIENKAWKAKVVTNESAFSNHIFCKTNKTGYTAGDWYTGRNGSGTKVTEDSIATANLTVYPNWIPKTVKVTFNCNGGSGGGTQTFTYGVSGQQFSKTCTRTGYKLAGWTLDSNTYSVNYTVSNTMINKYSPSVTVKAKWSVVTYSITYNLGGGSVSGNPTSYNINTATFTLKNPTRTGYNFKGWTGTGLTSANSSVTISKGSTGNRTYNANWSAKPVYITYNANGGTGTMSKTTCYYGQNCTAASNKFKYTGKDFVGWYANKNGTGSAYTTFKATGDITLYAKWKTASYTCSAGYYLKKSATSCNTACLQNYYCTGGTYSYSTSGDQGLTSCPSSYPKTASTGKKKDTDCYMEVPANKYVKKAKDASATACATGYSKTGPYTVQYGSTSSCTANTFTVKYNSNGGSGSMSNTSCTYDASCKLRANSFTRSSYKFIGWAKSASGSVVYDNKADVKNAVSSGTLNLYAKWEYTCDSDHPYQTSDNHCYKTLASALSNVNAGKTITLKKSLTDSSSPNLSTNKTVKLDLQGYTLTLSKASLRMSKGTLTITGKSSGSLITTSDITNVVNVSGGTLNINTITIHNKYNTSTAMHTVGLYMSGGTVNMSSGAIKAGAGSSSGHSLIVYNDGGTFNMSGGTLESNSTMASTKGGHGGSGLRTDSKGTSKITGGTIHVVRGGLDRCLLCGHSGGVMKLKGSSKYKWDGSVNSSCIFFYVYGSGTKICYENTVTLTFSASSSSCSYIAKFSEQGSGNIENKSSC